MLGTLKKAAAVIFISLLVFMSFFLSDNGYAASKYLFDRAGVMTDSEQSYVNDYLENVSDEEDVDVIAVITYGYDEEDLVAFADDFYDYGGFGRGDDRDGVIFAIDLKDREMVLVTTGYCTEAVTDYGEDIIYDYMTDNLRSGNYVEALTYNYADTVADFVDMARDGAAVDKNMPGHDGYDWYQDPDGYTSESGNQEFGLSTEGKVGSSGVIAIVVGAIAGLFSSQRKKGELKTVKKKTQANSYARRDSLVLTRSQDRFLYSSVAVTPRPKNNQGGNHGNGPGGTTMHTGSSGTPHGGGHARGF